MKGVTAGWSVWAGIAEAHVHTYRGAALTSSQFDQVAHLIDQEQSVAPAVRRALDSPGERVRDPPPVLYLTEDLRRVVPHLELAARTGVTEGVRGDLVHREDQVGHPSRGQAGALRVSLHHPADRRQVSLVTQRLRAGRRRGQRPIAV